MCQLLPAFRGSPPARGSPQVTTFPSVRRAQKALAVDRICFTEPGFPSLSWRSRDNLGEAITRPSNRAAAPSSVASNCCTCRSPWQSSMMAWGTPRCVRKAVQLPSARRPKKSQRAARIRVTSFARISSEPSVPQLTTDPFSSRAAKAASTASTCRTWVGQFTLVLKQKKPSAYGYLQMFIPKNMNNWWTWQVLKSRDLAESCSGGVRATTGFAPSGDPISSMTPECKGFICSSNLGVKLGQVMSSYVKPKKSKNGLLVQFYNNNNNRYSITHYNLRYTEIHQIQNMHVLWVPKKVTILWPAPTSTCSATAVIWSPSATCKIPPGCRTCPSAPMSFRKFCLTKLAGAFVVLKKSKWFVSWDHHPR